jgi:hypothetical protein
MYDGTTIPSAPPSILSVEALQAALVERHAGAKSFPDRENYVGASEVGSCMRLTAWRKLHPESNIFEPDAAGRMRAGQVMENEAVQMVRLALKGQVRETGANQSEIALPDAPIRFHPDGRLLASILDPLRWSRVPVLLASGARIYLEEMPEGDGALEIKTASSHQLRRFRKDGLIPSYLGQTQVQMGGQGMTWGLSVVVSRENLADSEVFFLQADPEHFDAMKVRARRVMDVVDKIRQGVCSEDALPDGEPDRGYCSHCPIADTCPSMVTARAAAGSASVIPPDEIPDVEALADEYLALKPEHERFEEVKDQLRDRLMAIGISKAILPSGRPLSLSERQGRESADIKTLKTKFPEVAAQVVTRGEPYYVMTVKEVRP